MSEGHSMRAMDAAMRAVFEAMPKSAPESPGNDERTNCEYCGCSTDNGDMSVIGDHWLCADCDMDGDACVALSRTIEEEGEVMVVAIKQATELLERARRYRARLRREES